MEFLAQTWVAYGAAGCDPGVADRVGDRVAPAALEHRVGDQGTALEILTAAATLALG